MDWRAERWSGSERVIEASQAEKMGLETEIGEEARMLPTGVHQGPELL